MIRRPPRSTLSPDTTLFRSGARRRARSAVHAGLRRIDRRRAERQRLIRRYGDPPRRPWIYLIVATGDIYEDRKSTRLNSSHVNISYAVFCLKKKRLTSAESS